MRRRAYGLAIATALLVSGSLALAQGLGGQRPPASLLAGYEEAADPATPVTEDFQADCIACHEPAKGSDWIYIEGYPVLAAGAVSGEHLPPRRGQ